MENCSTFIKAYFIGVKIRHTLITLLQFFLNVMMASTFLLWLDLLMYRPCIKHSFNSRSIPIKEIGRFLFYVRKELSTSLTVRPYIQ
jgi:hypothetical protein